MTHSCWWKIEQWEAWLGLEGVAHLSITTSSDANYILLTGSSCSRDAVE